MKEELTRRECDLAYEVLEAYKNKFPLFAFAPHVQALWEKLERMRKDGRE